MVSTESAAQAAIAGLEFDLTGYEIKARTSKGSIYDELYKAVPNMEVGKLYQLTEAMGNIPTRTPQLNKNNILHHLKKNASLKGYEFGGLIVSKEGVEPMFVLKLLKKPAETAAIPENLQKEGDAVVPGAQTED